MDFKAGSKTAGGLQVMERSTMSVRRCGDCPCGAARGEAKMTGGKQRRGRVEEGLEVWFHPQCQCDFIGPFPRTLSTLTAFT